MWVYSRIIRISRTPCKTLRIQPGAFACKHSAHKHPNQIRTCTTHMNILRRCFDWYIGKLIQRIPNICNQHGWGTNTWRSRALRKNTGTSTKIFRWNMVQNKEPLLPPSSHPFPSANDNMLHHATFIYLYQPLINCLSTDKPFINRLSTGYQPFINRLSIVYLHFMFGACAKTKVTNQSFLTLREMCQFLEGQTQWAHGNHSWSCAISTGLCAALVNFNKLAFPQFTASRS